MHTLVNAHTSAKGWGGCSPAKNSSGSERVLRGPESSHTLQSPQCETVPLCIFALTRQGRQADQDKGTKRRGKASAFRSTCTKSGLPKLRLEGTREQKNTTSGAHSQSHHHKSSPDSLPPNPDNPKSTSTKNVRQSQPHVFILSFLANAWICGGYFFAKCWLTRTWHWP